MTKKEPADNDRPDHAASQEAKLLWALDDLIDAEGPVMVTSWLAVVEYIDRHGDSQLTSLRSDMPQWRMTGILDAARDMLIEEYEYFEEDD